MHPDRRLFLLRTSRLATLAAAAVAAPGAFLGTDARAQTVPLAGIGNPFRLGVASGAPRPASVVLWTRLVANPVDPAPFAEKTLAVRWEIAEDDAFRRIAAKGTAPALQELGHSVHVEVDGLKPDRWYWYRFFFNDAASAVGRTRTAPPPGALPAQLRFAFASCQHWEFGEYGAHRHIAAADPDLVAFLGDYIYEWGPYSLQHPADGARNREIESITLEEYRMRYGQYRSDPHLQSAHQAAPWIVTWDDHEVANDYANDRDERRATDFLARRAAAYQAFYEHMPIRLGTLPEGRHRFAHMRVYDRYDWGRLARFHVLDNRQYRDYQACQPANSGGSFSVTAACAERTLPERSLLGREQEAWLAEGLVGSKARWNILAQQTLMAQSTQIPVHNEGEGRFWNDGWDGYPASRDRLFDDILKHKPANPIVISGDVHSFYANELKRNFYRPASDENPVIATEFVGASVTSSSGPQERTLQRVAMNPHMKYGRSDRRGFVMMEVTPSRTVARFQALDNVHDAAAGMSTVASFQVEDGKPGPQRID